MEALIAALPEVPPLRPDQQAIVDAILEDPHGVHVIIGPPGTGKTYVINALSIALRRKGLKVTLAASTGVAASRLENATTVHGAFNIKVERRRYQEGFLNPTTPLFKTIRATDAWIVDECYMMVSQIWGLLLVRSEAGGGSGGGAALNCSLTNFREFELNRRLHGARSSQPPQRNDPPRLRTAAPRALAF